MTKNKGLLNKAHITTYEELETFSSFDEIRQYIFETFTRRMSRHAN